MATLDRNLNMWRASDGSYFGTQQEAQDYEATGARPAANPDNDTSSYGQVYDSIAQQQAPEHQAVTSADIAAGLAARSPLGYVSSDPTAGARAQAASPAAQAQLAGHIATQEQQAHDAMAKRTGGTLGDLGRLGAYVGGAIANPVGAVAGDYIPPAAQFAINPAGVLAQQGLSTAASALPGGNGMGGLPGGSVLGNGSSSPQQALSLDPGSASAGQGGIRTPARPDAAGAGGAGAVPNDAAANVAADQAGRATDQKSLSDLYEESRYNGSPEADESRRNQQAALSKQAELYNMLAHFDPDAYAKKASDLAMSNELALARSQTGAAAGAEGLFTAQGQAPAIQAQAQRDADQALLARQQQAANVTGQMGQLATNTRGQDVGEAQLQSEFGVKIADGISQMTGLDWQLDSKESQSLAQIALSLDSENIEWAKLDQAGQIAEADRILAENGQAQQWREFKATLEAQGKLTDKDIYGGLLTLLGAGTSGYFGIQAAKAMGAAKAGSTATA
jgi:hypothetical protein